MRYWCIRFSDGSLGAPTTRDRAYAALNRIDADRRPLCSVVCLEEVGEEVADTLRPEAPDPFATEALELVGRQAMETLPEGDR